MDQICPPYLHILLGVTRKHHTLLENECHRLDQKLSQEVAAGKTKLEDDNFSEAFLNVVELQKKMQKGKDKIARLNVQARNDKTPELQQQIKQAKEALGTIKSKAKANPLPLLAGPLVANLDNTLKKHKIVPQAYHSRSFVGNHCHKYLKDDVYTDICESIPRKVQDITDNTSIIAEATAVSRKFKDLNARFSAVHQSISHQKPVSQEEIDSIETLVQDYMCFFRAEFPRIQIIPKQHLLEHHCVPWVQRYGMGISLLSEQGGESSHSIINSLMINARGIRDKQLQLTHLLRQQLALVAPALQAVNPVCLKHKD